MSKRRSTSSPRLNATRTQQSTPPPAKQTGASARRPVRAQRPRNLRRWALPAFLGLAGLAVATILYVGATTAPAQGGGAAVRPVLGLATAPVVIREYGDFQCPSCRAFNRTVEPQIRTAYIDTGKARLEWHDFAWIGGESRDAANAARCAGDQDKFWQYHDLLYQSQGGENSGTFSKDRLKVFGSTLGLDAVAFNACIDGGNHAGAVQADFANVSAQGFNGTPTFVIGTQRIVGAQPFSVFQAAIDAALASR